MKNRTRLLILLILAATTCHAQEYTLYTNGAFHTCNQKDAVYNIHLKRQNNNTYAAELKIQETGHLYAKCNSLFSDSIVFTGSFTSYYTNGNKNSTGQYKEGKRTGEWKHYSGNSKKLWWTYNHDNHSLKSYYENGVLKREEEQYPDGSVKTGKCYNETGEEIAFTPFEIYPEPSVDIANFLRKNLSYPTTAANDGKEGKVILRFCVKPNGTIGNIKVMRSVREDIDAEAVRVLKAMPRWKPGIQDDKPVSVFYTLPISFTL